MSVVFEADKARLAPGAPATHVLLVGCGEYPHLADAGYSLAPLTSPRQSVMAMADWFLGGPDASPELGLPSEKAFFNPAAPLGSVELLVSPSDAYLTPTRQSCPVERPTLSNTRAAYRRWLDRLGQNAESRGIFYFCGHGVGDGIGQVLIADDFGEDPHDAWSASFDVASTCQASIRQTSARLMYLIDACMEFSPDVLGQIGWPAPLVNGDRKGEPRCTEWLVMRASTTNRKAYAGPNEPARFTRALLAALNGHCGTQRIGQEVFDVTPSSLRNATAAFLQFFQEPGDTQWQKIATGDCDGMWNVPFHVLKRRPQSIVQLDVQPRGYRPVARAFMERAGQQRTLRDLEAGPAQFSVELGEWTYGVAPARDTAFIEQHNGIFLTEPVLPYCFTVA